MQGAVDGRTDVVAWVVVATHNPLAEVGESLDGGGDGVADGLEDGSFYIFLKMQKRQGTVVGVLGSVVKSYGDGYAAVGVGGVARGVAHSVDYLLAAVGGGGDDDTARAHAEGEDSVVVDLGGEAVCGGGKETHVGGAVVLYFVDKALGVLDADAKGEGFGLEQPSFGGE